MKVGVFDSGIGGKAVAEELQRLIPDAEVLYVSDSAHVPYGGRPQQEIIELTEAAIQPLLDAACDAIVIACNTATTNAIGALRQAYPAQHFVGLEPMVKPAAALTKTKTIAVLATPATLASERYAQLKNDWAADITVIEPDCASWASNIEHDAIEKIPLETTMSALKDNDVDVIVLGCTHYHWLKDRIEQLAGPTVTVLEPSNAIKERIHSLLD